MRRRRAGSAPAPPDVHEIVLKLVNHLDAMVAYWDIDQVCVFANDAYRLWFGKTSREMTGITLKGLLGPIYPKNLPYIRAAYEGKVQVFEREIPTPDGSVRHSLATYTPHIVDGEVRGIFVHVADVTPLKELEHELRAAKTRAEEIATHDFLTGLPNRVLLFDRITQSLAAARRSQQAVAVVSLDIDDFKKINDGYGHTAGDRFLIEIAARLKSVLREFDTVTRLGGDEFLVVAPEIESRTHAEAIAVRILEAASRPFALGAETISPTLSAGIALYPLHGSTPEALITSSDHALYAAKVLGKNRFAFAGPPET